MSNPINSAANFIRKINGYQFPRLGLLANRIFYKLMPERFEACLFPGITATLNKNDLTQCCTYWQGSRFESPTPQVLQSWITAETTHFFDIGSNYAFFSYWMLSQSTTLEVHAFEPNPKTFALVEEIKQRNGLSRLHPWNIGLSDKCETLALHPGVEDSGHSTFGPHPELNGTAIANIAVKPFSVWLREQGIAIPNKSAWLAKIDVEGFEMNVLFGMEECLRAKAFQGIAIEINSYTLKFCGTTPEAITEFICSCGYKKFTPSSECGNDFFVPA